MASHLRLAPIPVLAALLACGGGGSRSSASEGLHLNQTGTLMLTEDGFQFSVTDDGGHAVPVAWSVLEGSAGGSVDAQGYYLAPASPGTYHVVASRGAASVIATVQVVPGTPEIFINPGGPLHLATGGSQLFRAPINDLANHAVAWSLDGGGQLDPDGFFTAPATPGTCWITATSLADQALRKTTQIVVEAPSQPSFFIYTLVARFPAGTTVFFDQGLGGTADTRIDWSLTGGGSVNPDGVVTLPDQPGSVQLQMRSVAAPAVVQTIPIEVTAATDPVKATVQISPATATVAPGGTLAFAATVGGLPPRRRAVQWWIQEGRGAGGILTSDGRYTAPATPGTYHVVVTPLGEQRIRAVATVTVAP